ncbi:MAG: DUF3105 domain-containing protein [Myxococcales bacterium]|nr:DUF3105 domain-containing protein [Myxococcales bacterium]
MRLSLVLLPALVACTDDTSLPIAADADAFTLPASSTCGTGLRDSAKAPSAAHVADDVKVLYETVPPCIGDHRRSWLRWGTYDAPVVGENYVHNLEHGGIAILYDCPDGCPDDLEALNAYVAAVPADDGGAFRYILAPYPGLPKRISVVTWGQLLHLDCADLEQLHAFKLENYRKGPEDLGIMPP